MPIAARSATPAFGPSTSQEASDTDFVFLFSSLYPALSQAKLRLATMFSKFTSPLIRKSTENDSPAEKQNQKLYQQLLKRFQELETGHTKLQQQLNKLAREREGRRLESTEYLVSGSQIEASGGCFQGFLCKNPYWNILQSMGHAVYLCKPPSGEIIFWNRSAENLYGWKDYEILGQRVVEMLINEKEYMLVDKIMRRFNNGESWSGQFPFRKRSGEMFMAIVTESPMYEDGELTGIITVSSDASLFNNIKLENLKEYQERAHQRPREEAQNRRKIQWQPPPQIASSLSNLASKVFSRQHGDTSDGDASTNNSGEWTREVEQAQSEESTEERKNKGPLFEFVQPSKIAEKVFSKLNIGVGSNSSSRTNGSTQPDSADISARNSSKKPTELSSTPILKEHYTCFNGIDNLGLEENIEELSNPNRDTQNPFDQVSYAIRKKISSPQLGYDECFGKERLKVLSPKQDSDQEENGSTSAEVIPPKMPEVIQSPKSSGECNSASSHTSSSSRVEIESLADCEILWEDLHLGDEIGKGSSAVVYRGMWGGSDVAIKVYLGSEYQEGILMDYKKEIAIMKKLRHPNVLLFMGAVYSPDHLAIVTEFLPRGSLFRTLHRNNQTLDRRRRLRMALDVARGMNYLHRRNPPIVHRDLKSSNLLVDKNWNVKVGDFGLSRLKSSTFLTAKSGRGTPQWMAPEILRNEPSNEKSDIFSFGVILWELMTESIPWSNLNSLEVVGLVGFMDQRLELPEGLDSQVSSTIQDCWHRDPEYRPSFEQILQRMAILINAVAPAPLAQKKSEN